jgi:hypothetical protein
VASSPKKRSTSVCRAEGGDGELIAAIKERRWRDGARKWDPLIFAPKPEYQPLS